jgi:isopentenyl-diphosphate delta-isomerase type 1
LVDLVDERDVVIGTASIRDCLEKGLLHRAVAVLVVRSNGEFLLQQRSKKDLWHPGLWTLSCTGHVKAGEAYDEAAAREFSEELGISARLLRLGKRLLPPIKSGGLTEKEWVALYVTRTDERCRIDRTEVESVKEVAAPRLRRMFDEGSMTPDAVILLREYLEREKDAGALLFTRL